MGQRPACLRDVDVERQHREHFEMSPMVAVEVECATATRNPVGVICGSRRASVVGPQERQARYVLAGGAIPGIPTSNNTNKINILNGSSAPRRAAMPA